MVLERQQVKDQQSCISTFVDYLAILTRGTSLDLTKVFHAWPYGRFIELEEFFSGTRQNVCHDKNTAGQLIITVDKMSDITNILLDKKQLLLAS